MPSVALYCHNIPPVTLGTVGAARHHEAPCKSGGIGGGAFTELLGTSTSLLSTVYMCQHNPSCFRLLRHCVVCALLLARESAGSSSPARIAMIAITTSNSIKVNPGFFIAVVFIAGMISFFRRGVSQSGAPFTVIL